MLLFLLESRRLCPSAVEAWGNNGATVVMGSWVHGFP
jgi:hypothetical protein